MRCVGLHFVHGAARLSAADREFFADLAVVVWGSHNRAAMVAKLAPRTKFGT